MKILLCYLVLMTQCWAHPCGETLVNDQIKQLGKTQIGQVVFAKSSYKFEVARECLKFLKQIQYRDSENDQTLQTQLKTLSRIQNNFCSLYNNQQATLSTIPFQQLSYNQSYTNLHRMSRYPEEIISAFCGKNTNRSSLKCDIQFADPQLEIVDTWYQSFIKKGECFTDIGNSALFRGPSRFQSIRLFASLRRQEDFFNSITTQLTRQYKQYLREKDSKTDLSRFKDFLQVLDSLFYEGGLAFKTKPQCPSGDYEFPPDTEVTDSLVRIANSSKPAYLNHFAYPLACDKRASFYQEYLSFQFNLKSPNIFLAHQSLFIDEMQRNNKSNYQDIQTVSGSTFSLHTAATLEHNGQLWIIDPVIAHQTGMTNLLVSLDKWKTAFRDLSNLRIIIEDYHYSNAYMPFQENWSKFTSLGGASLYCKGKL